MMTNHELFQRAFQNVQPSQDCMDRLYSLGEHKPRRRLSRTGAVVLAAVLVLCLAVSASAAAGNIIGQFHTWSGGVITWYETEDGEQGGEAVFDYDDTNIPAELRDDRLYFIANGENIDITDVISDTQAYTYSFTDEQGTYYFIIGGEPESFGWAEYDRDANGEWISGRFQGKDTNSSWLQNAKEELGIPWYY